MAAKMTAKAGDRFVTVNGITVKMQYNLSISVDTATYAALIAAGMTDYEINNLLSQELTTKIEEGI